MSEEIDIGIRDALSSGLRSAFSDVMPEVVNRLNKEREEGLKTLKPQVVSLLRKYHDDYGEFDYERCAKDLIKRFTKVTRLGLRERT
jgi:hypothetical protein